MSRRLGRSSDNRIGRVHARTHAPMQGYNEPTRGEYQWPDHDSTCSDADGSNQRPLTDNQYEEGTPAWLPEALLKRE